MVRDRHRTFSDTIIKLFLAIPAFFNIIVNAGELLRSEARLVSNNIMKLIVLLVVISSLMIINWIGILYLLFFFLASLELNRILSVSIILLLNTVLIIILILM